MSQNQVLLSAKRHGRALSICLTVAIISTATLAGQTYTIMNVNSGKVLDVSGGSSPTAYQNGTAIQQWDWLGGANQQWNVVPLGNGYNEIVNVQSGKVLDVRGVSMNPFAIVQQWDWLWGANQQWQLVDLGDGTYKILNRNSSLVLDVEGARPQNGAGILQLWDSTSTPNGPTPSQAQPSIQWVLIPISGGAAVGMPTDSGSYNAYGYAVNGACSGPSPGFSSLALSWLCGSQVKVRLEGFNKSEPLQSAINNWNGQLAARFGYPPVIINRDVGGPEGIHAYRVANNAIACNPQAANCYARAQNTNQVLWRPPNVTPPGSSRLRFADIQIIKGMSYGPTLTNTFAHELGHTFGLIDCQNCGGSTVMDVGEEVVAPTDYRRWNFTEGTPGPTKCDINVIQNNIPEYSACQQVAVASGPQSQGCVPGASQGFANIGPSSEHTCNGAVCDGCNGACNNFAPGNGCSGTPDPGCSTSCGSVCMDGVYCPFGYLGSSYSPSCDPNGNVYCPSETNYSPILLDTSGEGFHLTSVESGVYFSLVSGKPSRQISWTDPAFHNGWLVLDRNGNGTVDDLSEMFGNFTNQPTADNPNGYLALAVFDDPMHGGNANGYIDAGDQIFSSLQVWIDANHNGISEPEELSSLYSFGITAISLNYIDTPTVDAFGNAFRYKSTVITNANSGEVSYDVYLQVQRPQ